MGGAPSAETYSGRSNTDRVPRIVLNLGSSQGQKSDIMDFVMLYQLWKHPELHDRQNMVMRPSLHLWPSRLDSALHLGSLRLPLALLTLARLIHKRIHGITVREPLLLERHACRPGSRPHGARLVMIRRFRVRLALTRRIRATPSPEIYRERYSERNRNQDPAWRPWATRLGARKTFGGSWSVGCRCSPELRPACACQ